MRRPRDFFQAPHRMSVAFGKAGAIHYRTGATASPETEETPDWIREALTYLQSAAPNDTRWGDLLEAWVALERALGFPSGTVSQVSEVH